MPLAHWYLRSKAAWIARSSHCVSVTKSGVVAVYGGELKPRTPIDDTLKGSMHIFDLRQENAADKSSGWKTLSPIRTAQQLSEVPEPRVGATMVVDGGSLYMWGGRGGVDMAPLGPEEIGMWKAVFDEGDPSGITWKRIKAVNPEEGPEPRSYHASIAQGGRIYVHAGCPTSGRLGTLHAFNIDQCRWQSLATAPDPARGGTSLVAASLEASAPILLRFGGFSGYELPSTPGVLDIYFVNEDKWTVVQPEADVVHGSPASRSVHGFSRFRSRSPALSNAVALLFHGERDASSLGHAGAGTFWDDIWLLTKDKAVDSTRGWAWKKVDVAERSGEGNLPESRGWIASDEWAENGESRIVMQGGLLSSNERSDELWELRIE
ncbi:uncharacterized protein FIBRA_05940 [Fibroporia radiculosa]|uniref:Galactose oxidase n=1 Tax=Fibroporia radiculosa TaxID=599839 RepID=J4HYB8_9APHY|nr:uncharacterized protein FIBRA_05940 [Fibroporia radiculosa]CCM03792.1 predicted protein [Fibroporia radiculosa]